jgi:hypothetical protein
MVRRTAKLIVVTEYCTCGAELPPDARFCHKCGKPQREEVVPETIEVAPPPAAAILVVPEVSRRIDFHNSAALRVGFFCAVIANFINLLPYLLLGCPLWLILSGFLAAYLYERRTGQSLSVRSGARMGWLTGLFSFAIFTVFFTFSFVASVRSGAFANIDRNQLNQIPFLRGNVDQVIQVLQSPVGLATNLVISLIILFAIFTIFSIVGGAIGGKILSRNGVANSE